LAFGFYRRKSIVFLIAETLRKNWLFAKRLLETFLYKTCTKQQNFEMSLNRTAQNFTFSTFCVRRASILCRHHLDSDSFFGFLDRDGPFTSGTSTRSGVGFSTII
jgi:hypothetical protein